MNLLVTGGAGFIGSNFIHHVIDKPEVRVLVNLDCFTYAGDERNVVEFECHSKYALSRADLRNKQAIPHILRNSSITHVIHFAAESHVDRSISGPAPFIQTNIVGTFNLLEACVSNKVQRFLHVSTDEVYGSRSSGKFTEEAGLNPSSPYAASKASADMLVQAYHKTYGLNTVITRSANNYGPRQFPEKLIPVIINNALNQKPIPLYGDGMHVRDWLYVENHVEALWSVLTQGKVGEIYNIGGGHQCTNSSLICQLGDIVYELAGLSGDPADLITFVKDRPGHDRRYAADAFKIHRELGWKPKTPFNEGLRKTVEWYLGARTLAR